MFYHVCERRSFKSHDMVDDVAGLALWNDQRSRIDQNSTHPISLEERRKALFSILSD